jgi:hypothetical protein
MSQNLGLAIILNQKRQKSTHGKSKGTTLIRRIGI